MSVRIYDVGAVISELRDEMLAANEVRERRAPLIDARALSPHSARAMSPHGKSHLSYSVHTLCTDPL